MASVVLLLGLDDMEGGLSSSTSRLVAQGVVSHRALTAELFAMGEGVR